MRKPRPSTGAAAFSDPWSQNQGQSAMSTKNTPPARPDPVLAEHAAAIRKLGRQTVENVVEIGRLLTECKRICGHGKWLPWLEREFGWEETTAQRFMRVHELALSKSGNLPDLPVSAIYLLAAPSTPKEARDEIIERAQAGEKVKVAKAKRVIKRHKSQSSKRKQRQRHPASIRIPGSAEVARHEKLGRRTVSQLRHTSL